MKRHWRNKLCITHSYWPERNQFLAVASPWRLPRSAQTLIPGRFRRGKIFLHQVVIKPNSSSGVVNEILGDFLYVHQPWFLGGLRKVEKVSRESFSAKKISSSLKTRWRIYFLRLIMVHDCTLWKRCISMNSPQARLFKYLQEVLLRLEGCTFPHWIGLPADFHKVSSTLLKFVTIFRNMLLDLAESDHIL